MKTSMLNCLPNFIKLVNFMYEIELILCMETIGKKNY